MVTGGFALSDQILGEDSTVGAIMVPALCVLGGFLYGRIEKMLVRDEIKVTVSNISPDKHSSHLPR